MPQWTEYQWVFRKLLYQSPDGVDCLRLLVRDAKPLRALRYDNKKRLEALVRQHLKPDKGVPPGERASYEQAYHSLLERLNSAHLGTRAVKTGLGELRNGMGRARSLHAPVRYDPEPLVDLFLIAMYNYETSQKAR